MPDDSGGNQGPATDQYNNPVVDPTANVILLVEAAVKRQDDLRVQDSTHVREIMELRALHTKEMRAAEAKRIDAIRAVDVGAVSISSQVAAQQAETLRVQVATTAAAQDVALRAALEPLQKDIADLRRAQYEAQGVRTQTGDQRLNVGALLGAFSVLIAVVALILTLK
jgi:hypothetical protein